MALVVDRKPLGHFLMTRGVVQQEQIDRALEEQRQSSHQKLIGELLIERNFCTDAHIAEALAESYEVPFVRATPRLVDPKIVSLLPREFLEKHHALPMFLVEGTLTVAIAEPANLFLIEEIERISGHAAQIVVSTRRDIDATLAAYLSGANTFVIDELPGDGRDVDITLLPRRIEIPAGVEPQAGEMPVVRFVNHCIQQAIADGATELHVEPGDNSLRVRSRIDGRLTEKVRPPRPMHAAIVARMKTMAGLEVAERRISQEGDCRIMAAKRPVELRISTMPGKWGEHVVVRILDQTRTSATLEKLGFGYDTLKQWRKLIAQPNGLLAVAGPTGSGKSATLYASLREVNSDQVNLCTIEDPIFGDLPGVNQFEVNDKAGLSFPTVLRSVLRQYPDVVMVGETREPETAKLAMQAAITGHLVMTTLNTNDAPTAIHRLFHLGVEPYLVGASLLGVLSQRLVRKLCQTCKEPYAPTITERRHLEKFGVGAEDTLFRPKGCPRCRHLGYLGRIGIYELLVVEDTLAERLSQGAGLADIREIARKLGMKPLRHDGIDKVKAGITTLEEVYRVTV